MNKSVGENFGAEDWSSKWGRFLKEVALLSETLNSVRVTDE